MSPAPATDHASLLARVLDPAAPKAARLAAARGALPLGRQETILAQVRLSADSDPEVSAEAQRSLSVWPADALAAILGDPATDGAVLEHFARRPGTSPTLLASLVTNPSLSDEALLHLAGVSEASVLDQIIGNESRLARNPAIAAILKANQALSRPARRRLTELEEHVVGHEEIAFQARVAPAPTEEPAGDVPLPPPEALVEETPAPVLEIPLTPEEQAAEEALRRTPVFLRIVRMNVAEKIQAAIKGNAEERAILIRDPSRIVSTTVLKSPKLNEQEIENYANLRNVNDEVLRIIGTHRDWTKSYGVAHSLVRNPRTPTGISLTMLNRLVNKDLKNLGTDKNIPEVIRRSAKRLFDLRTKPAEKGKRK
ncbi:MAG TPA: hypothetical protein VGR67_05930 [Candidatus Polarisedimenticolia bacterium]|jgi:hypothetical protein|nr:hypothetical protein [Candidatus Polarisedimenticolia bacterium]